MHSLRRRRRPHYSRSEHALLGDVQRFPIPDLIEFLVQQRARGKLQVRDGHCRATIALWDGWIVGASSSKIREDDPDFLAPYFSIDDAQLDPEKFKDNLAQAVEAVLTDMLSMSKSRFSFGYFPTPEPVPHSLERAAIDARFAIFEALRKRDEASRTVRADVHTVG